MLCYTIDSTIWSYLLSTESFEGLIFFAQAQAETLHHLVQSRQGAAEVLQETRCKAAAKQMETALFTADTGHQVREVRS